MQSQDSSKRLTVLILCSRYHDMFKFCCSFDGELAVELITVQLTSVGIKPANDKHTYVTGVHQ